MGNNKNFFYRIDAGPLLAEVIQTPEDERGKKFLQLALDMVNGKGTFPYSKQIIAEVSEFKRKKSEAGRKGMENRWLRDNSVITENNSDISKEDFVITRSSNSNSNNSSTEEKIKTPRKKKEVPDLKAKIVYAENVTMTPEEHAKLVAEHGEAFTAACIAKISNYKGANGKTYKSDYLAILSWVIDEVKKKFTSFATPDPPGPLSSEDAERIKRTRAKYE